MRRMLAFALVLSASPSAQMKVESLHGAPTRAEVDSLLSYVQTQTPAPSNQANAWSYGKSGQAVRALGVVYEITGRVDLLNEMLRWCDASILARNDFAPAPDGHRTLWTGDVGPGYPNDFDKQPIATSGADGDGVGAAAYCARLILTRLKPSWNTPIPTPDTNHFGATYLARAKTYLKQADFAMDHHILSRLLDLSKKDRMYFAKDSPYKGGDAVPWNQQVMFTYALSNLEAAHAVLQDDAARQSRYHAIVQTNAEWFFKDGSRLVKDKFGNPARDWDYGVGSRDEDATHSQMDFAGYELLYRMGYVTREQMTQLANTFVDVMTLAPGRYAGFVNGSSGTAKHALPGTQIRSGDLLLGPFRPEAYDAMVATVLHEGAETSNTELFSRFLYTKTRLAEAANDQKARR